jgi:putative endonuclease
VSASVKLPLKLKKRQLSSKQQRLPNVALGSWGETQAQNFLQNKGYRILHRNISCGTLEIDIVALDPSTHELAFVEVKTRSQDFSGHPSVAVDWLKKRALFRAAKMYCKLQNYRGDYRFDIISVLPRSIEHFENITW